MKCFKSNLKSVILNFNRSATHSLKREHKRKFNRSLCGVLLGVSIVLVILGILGIIGIAVYLGGKIAFSLQALLEIQTRKSERGSKTELLKVQLSNGLLGLPFENRMPFENQKRSTIRNPNAFSFRAMTVFYNS